MHTERRRLPAREEVKPWCRSGVGPSGLIYDDSEPATGSAARRRSLTVVFGFFFACFLVTKRPVLASRYTRGAFAFGVFALLFLAIGSLSAARASL